MKEEYEILLNTYEGAKWITCLVGNKYLKQNANREVDRETMEKWCKKRNSDKCFCEEIDVESNENISQTFENIIRTIYGSERGSQALSLKSARTIEVKSEELEELLATPLEDEIS